MGVQILPWEGATLRGEGRPTVKYKDTAVSCAKTAELIETPFELRTLRTLMGSRNHVLDGVHITPWEEAILRGQPIVRYRDILWEICKND